MNTNEYGSQKLLQGNERLIMNPFELLIHQLQAKDLSSRKSSIDTVHIIALTMDEREITNQLLPFLVKLLIEQSSKDLKISIVKSFKNILPLLTQSSSLLTLVEILLDVVLAFNQPQLKTQALTTLNTVLFQSKALKFETFKQPFHQIVVQELPSIAEQSNQKGPRQIIIYLLKYMFINAQKIPTQQIEQLIQLLRKTFLQNKQKDFLNIKVFAENLHLLVQSWPSQYLNQLLIIINYLTGSTNTQMTTSNQNQHKNQETTPQSSIPQQILPQVKINIVPALICLAKKIDQSQAFSYIEKLLKEENTKVKIALIKKTKLIFETFDSLNLDSFLTIFKTFPDQPQDIKKAILQVLDYIPIDQNDKKEQIIKMDKNSIELKNILIQSLIRSNKSDSVSQILHQSDYDFKIKIFTKLPDSLLHKNSLYAEIVDSLLSEAKKNFRSKLNVVLNLIFRVEEKVKTQENLGSTFDVSYLITPLMKYFGDKIAIIRVNVAKLFAMILFYLNVPFDSFATQSRENFYGQSKNWLEKQTVLIMFKQYLSLYQQQNLQGTDQIQVSKMINQDFYRFIITVLKDSIEGFPNKESQNKRVIANIASLAQQIIKQFSIQI